MIDQQFHPTLQSIAKQRPFLTPKGRVLADFVLKNPRKAVFMTTRNLAKTCQVSEATVVRFVNRLGYQGYGSFQQALRDFVDTELTLLDRTDLSGIKEPAMDRLGRVIFEEMENLKSFYETGDRDVLNNAVTYLEESASVYVIGSRLSYTFAYYLGWSLTKVRSNVHIIKGSDSTSIDWLTIAPPDSLVVIIATSRYPNELIKLGKTVRRLNLPLLLIADGSLCPLTQFSHLSLIAPTRNIPFIGNPTTISCIINYLVMELASRDNNRLKAHHEKLEQAYLENDILFNLQKETFNLNC
ncbi:MAG: transcriptional regulator, RpiR family protein [Desulfobacteraceae bacterium 4572_123]|nr:MAG: transcriptional regulator, RpiR family protein [Desulfobacteraceae bacterium 4572_123]